jgi:hypothetical protein
MNETEPDMGDDDEGDGQCAAPRSRAGTAMPS